MNYLSTGLAIGNTLVSVGTNTAVQYGKEIHQGWKLLRAIPAVDIALNLGSRATNGFGIYKAAKDYRDIPAAPIPVDHPAFEASLHKASAAKLKEQANTIFLFEAVRLLPYISATAAIPPDMINLVADTAGFFGSKLSLQAAVTELNPPIGAVHLGALIPPLALRAIRVIKAGSYFGATTLTLVAPLLGPQALTAAAALRTTGMCLTLIDNANWLKQNRAYVTSTAKRCLSAACCCFRR